MSWNRILSATTKNCFINPGFCKAKRDKLKVLKIPDSIPGDVTREERETWVAMDNDNPITHRNKVCHIKKKMKLRNTARANLLRNQLRILKWGMYLEL